MNSIKGTINNVIRLKNNGKFLFINEQQIYGRFLIIKSLEFIEKMNKRDT
jgi:hypothetical protein